jgi:hypothetical protein
VTDPVAVVRKNEGEIKRLLAPSISDWIALTERLERLKWELLADQVTRTPAQGIAQMICGRLQNDMRSAVLLTQRGYVLQALSLAAGMLEMGFALGWMAAHEERATEWHKWNSERSVPTKNVWEAIKETFANGGQPDANVKSEFDHYTQLCKAKHGNPIIFRTFGIKLTDDDQLIVYHGPYLSDSIVRAARLAMWYTVRYMLLGLTCYNDFHVPVERHGVREIALAECREEMT